MTPWALPVVAGLVRGFLRQKKWRSDPVASFLARAQGAIAAHGVSDFERAAFDIAKDDMIKCSRKFGYHQAVVVFWQTYELEGGDSPGVLCLVQKELGVPVTGIYDADTKEAVALNSLIK